jgi:hypothetical protein
MTSNNAQHAQHAHSLRLADAVCTRLGLQVVLRIPVRVEDNLHEGAGRGGLSSCVQQHIARVPQCPPT